MRLNGMFTRKSITFRELGIDLGNIWSVTGNDGYVPDAQSQALFESVAGEIAAACRPEYGYAVFRSEGVDKDSIRLGGRCFHVGAIIASYLKQAEEFALFVATAGVGFEALQRRLHAEGDIVRQFFADMIGSEIAEAAGRILSEELAAEQGRRGFSISNSYSPGYCGWHVSDQHALFALLPDSPCGITLNDSSLMTPIKSVSGVIALGPKVEKRPYGCAICGKKDCYKNQLRKKKNR